MTKQITDTTLRKMDSVDLVKRLKRIEKDFSIECSRTGERTRRHDSHMVQESFEKIAVKYDARRKRFYGDIRKGTHFGVGMSPREAWGGGYSTASANSVRKVVSIDVSVDYLPELLATGVFHGTNFHSRLKSRAYGGKLK